MRTIVIGMYMAVRRSWKNYLIKFGWIRRVIGLFLLGI